MTPTIESKVAITILEEYIGEVTLDGKTYRIPAPTTSTIIMASALISQLPEFDLNVPDDQLPAEVLKHGAYGATLGSIAATLMLGAKRIKEKHIVQQQTATKRHWSWRHFKYVSSPAAIDTLEIDYLTQKLLDNCTTAQIREITFALVKEGGLDDFFILTTSLHAKNLLAPTREVEKMTVSGHS